MNTQIKRPNTLAIHSLRQFAITVPDLGVAEHFYSTFGLRVERHGSRLDLYTHGHPHRWGQVFEQGQAKKIAFLSLGCYAEDEQPLKERVRQMGHALIDPHPLSDGLGFWLRDPDGTPVQVLVSDKVTPSQRTPDAGPIRKVNPIGAGIAPMRSEGQKVLPERLSHVLIFATDVPRSTAFYTDVLGFRLSDKSIDVIAFMHGAHSSDHHLLAMAKSEAPGFHHASWVVPSIDQVGLGMEQMHAAGYTQGWGVGRHVIGSNYFYYARDPWGSFCEFSYDIDYIDVSTEWPAGDYPPEDSMNLWGPPLPDYFIQNTEAAAHAVTP
ncbi:MAG: hypothetical protein RL657_744 [Pseudomonadota bacterium]